jgi:hypothetical protein
VNDKTESTGFVGDDVAELELPRVAGVGAVRRLETPEASAVDVFAVAAVADDNDGGRELLSRHFLLTPFGEFLSATPAKFFRPEPPPERMRRGFAAFERRRHRLECHPVRALLMPFDKTAIFRSPIASNVRFGDFLSQRWWTTAPTSGGHWARRRQRQQLAQKNKSGRSKKGGNPESKKYKRQPKSRGRKRSKSLEATSGASRNQFPSFREERAHRRRQREEQLQRRRLKRLGGGETKSSASSLSGSDDNNDDSRPAGDRRRIRLDSATQRMESGRAKHRHRVGADVLASYFSCCGGGGILAQHALPGELWKEVFCWIPSLEILRVWPLVCKHWRGLRAVSHQYLCERRGWRCPESMTWSELCKLRYSHLEGRKLIADACPPPFSLGVCFWFSQPGNGDASVANDRAGFERSLEEGQRVVGGAVVRHGIDPGVMQNDGLCLFTAEVDTPAVLPRSEWNGKRVTIVWNLRIDNSRYDVSEDTEPNDYALWRIY